MPSPAETIDANRPAGLHGARELLTAHAASNTLPNLLDALIPIPDYKKNIGEVFGPLDELYTPEKAELDFAESFAKRQKINEMLDKLLEPDKQGLFIKVMHLAMLMNPSIADPDLTILYCDEIAGLLDHLDTVAKVDSLSSVFKDAEDQFIRTSNDHPRASGKDNVATMVRQLFKEIEPGQFQQKHIAELREREDVQRDFRRFSVTLGNVEAQRSFIANTQDLVRYHDLETCRVVLEIAKRTATVPYDSNPDGAASWNAAIDVVNRYGKKYTISTLDQERLVDELVPRLLRKDLEIPVVVRGGNIWGMKRGEPGVAEFEVRCITLQPSPKAMHELMMLHREIPTSDLHRLEQNRKDALSLRNVFGIVRDFIHDQRPGVHDAVKAMLEYYESVGTQEKKQLLVASVQGTYLEREATIFDLANYDALLPLDDQSLETKPAIYFLRRVVENTRPVPAEARWRVPHRF